MEPRLAEARAAAERAREPAGMAACLQQGAAAAAATAALAAAATQMADLDGLKKWAEEAGWESAAGVEAAARATAS